MTVPEMHRCEDLHVTDNGCPFDWCCRVEHSGWRVLESTSFQIKDGFLHELLYRYEISVSQMTTDMLHLSDVTIPSSFPLSWLIIGLLFTRVTRRELCTRPEYPSSLPVFFCGIRIVQSSIFCLFVLCCPL